MIVTSAQADPKSTSAGMGERPTARLCGAFQPWQLPPACSSGGVWLA